MVFKSLLLPKIVESDWRFVDILDVQRLNWLKWQLGKQNFNTIYIFKEMAKYQIIIFYFFNEINIKKMSK